MEELSIGWVLTEYPLHGGPRLRRPPLQQLLHGLPLQVPVREVPVQVDAVLVGPAGPVAVAAADLELVGRRSDQVIEIDKSCYTGLTKVQFWHVCYSTIFLCFQLLLRRGGGGKKLP